MARGRSVRLYLAEGSATGILTAEIINWTGHVLAAPRTRLDVALRRSEMVRTGVYLLVGTDTATDLPAVYVGEGDAIGDRIRSHARDDDKDYWDRVIAITSKDMNLTKAHVRYLESRLITLLKDARKSTVMNRTDPGFERLPEADVADMESFLDEIQLILPVIGVDCLRRPQLSSPIATPTLFDASNPSQPSPDVTIPVRFELVHATKGIRATAVEAEGEFVILSGATGSLNIAPSFNDKMRALRDQALDTGRAVVVDQTTFRLTEDIAFSSPSAASVFLFGTSRNGRTDWHVEDQPLSYAAFKDSQLS